MKHFGTKEIETRNLFLRRFQLDDAEKIFRNWTNDDEVTTYLMWPTHKDINVTIGVLNNWIQNYKNDNFYLWAIVLKEIKEPIGSISIVKQLDEIKMVHFGYCIGKKWWNKGITSEALKALIKFFFEEVGVNRIESRYDLRNPNSGKVMQKCGMKYEGLKRQGDYNNQGICDSVEYGLIAEEYFKEKSGS